MLPPESLRRPAHAPRRENLGIIRRLPYLVPALATGATVVVGSSIGIAPGYGLASWLGVAILAVCIWRSTRLIFERDAGPVQITFWPFVGIWMGFAPLVQLNSRQLPWPDSDLSQLYPQAQLLTLGALAAFSIGSLSSNRKDKSFITNQTEAQVYVRYALMLMLVLVAVTTASGISIESRFGTRDDLINAYANQGISYDSTSTLLGFVKLLPTSASIALAYLSLRWYRPGRRRLVFLTIVILGLSAVVIYANPLSNGRFAAFSGILAIVFARMSFSRLAIRAVVVAGAFAGIAVGYPLATIFKNSTLAARTQFGIQSFTSVDFDGFQQTVNTAYYVSTHGITYGYQVVSAMFFWVPRAVWSSKSEPGSFLIAASRSYKFENLSLPFWSEMYLNFGVFGMLIVMFLYGRIARRLDHLVRTGSQHRLAILAPLLAAWQIGFLRGPLGAQIPSLAATLFIAWISVRQGRVRDPSGLALPQTL